MNDMPRDLLPPEPASREKALQSAHIFRSKLIERCAQVERWIAQMMASITPATSGKSRPALVLLGNRLDEIRDLARKSPERFKNPGRIIEKMDQFQPYAELRSELAHAMTDALVLEDGTVQIQFDNAGLVHPLIERRIILGEEKMREIANDLANLVNQIRQLELK
ncbi:hypothetical protein [Sphingopyxis witflariensis]|uniref:Uncharacterized protein n=1 Tax=Sphingopyxis witflariensis TaxID=173675 RepID=A0A246JES0_9SPHN|nr:hypothetical protein [Sphingopyxis witflariensis]OWQ91109.1 hypothetical protein CDQ91_19415 [Sphingopyxis witflariensis]